MVNDIAEVGNLFRLEQGEYSDYTVLGIFKVIKAFIPQIELNEYLAEFPDQQERYNFNSYKFVHSLVSQGLLEEVPHIVMYLGGYGTAAEFEVSESELINWEKEE